MAQPVGVDDALDTLVQQFSDPLACLRELVQNSLDAGSRQIDVTFEHADGVMTIEVQDYGEGMDRAIIDTRLTRLFSSSKEGDFTKIGRFGIGFVSVFALKPDAVCVDTGRGGERWRILFKQDRSFVRIALDEPVAGTRIRILKAVTAERCEGLRARAGEVLRYWCKHVEGEIWLDGSLVSGPLALDALCEVRHAEEGTLVLVGVPTDGRTFAGFYNKGLTLHEGPEQGLAGLAFKVSSRYLEHTLTRDNVLHDAQYERAMAIVRRLAGQPLHAALLAQACAGGTQQTWRALADRLRLGAVPAELLGEPVLPAEGGALSISAVRQAASRGRLYHAPEADALSARRHQAGDRVLLLPEAALGAAREAAGADVPALHRRFVLPRLPETSKENERFRPLQEATRRLLGAVGAKLGDVVLAHLPPALADDAAITTPDATEPVPMAELRRLDAGLLARKRTLVVNVDHPTVAHLIRLAATEPAAAAWMLVRLFFLRSPVDPDRDAALLAATLRLRGEGGR
ncbi:MAG: ATP-binding protein [bacterium]